VACKPYFKPLFAYLAILLDNTLTYKEEINSEKLNTRSIY